MNGTPVKRGSSAGIAAVAGLALALGAACGSSDKAGPHDRAQLARIVTHSESKLLGFRDVDQLLAAGKIKNKGLANSLQAKLRAAAAGRGRGQCNTAANIYGAFINGLDAQVGKGIDAHAVALLMTDVQYLLDHCP